MSDDSLKPCNICDELASFERESLDEPPEGDVCSICSFWVCDNCVDWVKSGYRYDVVCIECSKKIGGNYHDL